MKTILIVDDSEDSMVALEYACAAIRGATVTRVFSALEAVRLLRIPNHLICAVVTDIHMPRMDGYELIRFIRTDQASAAIPIIVITADPDPETPERAASLGANACFSKPFSPVAVRRTLEGLLNAKPKME